MQRTIGAHLPLEADRPPRIGPNPRLERVATLFDWARLEGVVQDIYAAPTGRPSYPPLMLVKVLLLQQWYHLSDPEMEAALWDRLLFRRFVGLGLADEAPALRHDQSLSSAVDRPRAGRGVVRRGQSATGSARASDQGRHVGASAGAPAAADGGPRRDAEAAASLPAGALPGLGTQYDGAVVQVSRLQPAPRRATAAPSGAAGGRAVGAPGPGHGSGAGRRIMLVVLPFVG